MARDDTWHRVGHRERTWRKQQVLGELSFPLHAPSPVPKGPGARRHSPTLRPVRPGAAGPATMGWWRAGRGRASQPRFALRPVHPPGLRLGLQFLILHRRESKGSLRLLPEALTPMAGVPACSAGCPRGCRWTWPRGPCQEGWARASPAQLTLVK